MFPAGKSKTNTHLPRRVRTGLRYFFFVFLFLFSCFVLFCSVLFFLLSNFHSTIPLPFSDFLLAVLPPEILLLLTLQSVPAPSNCVRTQNSTVNIPHTPPMHKRSLLEAQTTHRMHKCTDTPAQQSASLPKKT